MQSIDGTISDTYEAFVLIPIESKTRDSQGRNKKEKD